MCEQLAKVVTWQCPNLESNLQPQGYKFGTLPLHYQATSSNNYCRQTKIFTFSAERDYCFSDARYHIYFNGILNE